MLFKIISFINKQFEDIKTYGIKELFRKFYLLIKVLEIIPIFIIAIVPCIIIRLISPWIIIRIERIGAENFANFSCDLSIYYCKKKLKIDLPTTKHFDLVYIHYKDKIYNKQLAKMWKRKLNFLPGYLLDPINKVNKLIPGWRKHSIEILSSKLEYDIDNLFDKCQSLDFTNEEEIYGEKMLNKFGLKNQDKFVCLAVRDNEYNLIKDPNPRKDFSYHDFRNQDIDDFVLAAEELAKRGYYVFRMGVVAKKPINSKNPKIIDYVNSSLRSDFMDVYLGAKCSFCLSTGYGFDSIPYIFARPIALMSLPVGDLRAHSERFLLLTKHHILKKEKRKLSLSEIFSYGVAFAFDKKIFEKNGIELVDYIPNEIKDFAIEMDESLKSKKELNLEDEKLQKTFKSLFALNIKNINYHAQVEKPMHKLQGKIKSRFSTKFLKNNRDWLR